MKRSYSLSRSEEVDDLTSHEIDGISRADMSRFAYVKRAKRELWQQFRNPDGLGFLSVAETELKSKLNVAFRQCMSTSVLVVGPDGSGKKNVIDSVLRSFRDKNGLTPFAVARVQPNICPTDHDALCSISSQLCVRAASGHNLVTALEDLEDHFRHCAIDKQPSVVVLEDVHEFAVREKQVLIYTLLDYMHRSDMLFVFLGCTPCAHLQNMLEKRVLSRLNAQFVYLSPASGEDICRTLAERLTLQINVGTASQGSDISQIDVNQDEISYRLAFNERVGMLMGIATNCNDSVNKKRGLVIKRGNQPPQLLPLISRYVDWGKGMGYFIRVALLAIARLGLSMSKGGAYFLRDVFTQEMWEGALSSQNPRTLSERLSSVPLHELYLYASPARCQARTGVTNSIANYGKTIENTECNATALSRRPKCPSVTVGDVLCELDILTGVVLRRETSVARIKLGLKGLSKQNLMTFQYCDKSSSRSVTDQTVLTLLSPNHDIQSVFKGHTPEISENLQVMSAPLVVSDKVRRAVLEPMVVPTA